MIVVCAAAMGLIVFCIADAGRRVSLTGGPYAYVGVAFGAYAGFKSGLLHKDLLIVREMARAAGIRASVIEQSLADYGELMARGLGDEDTSALILLKREGGSE